MRTFEFRYHCCKFHAKRCTTVWVFSLIPHCGMLINYCRLWCFPARTGNPPIWWANRLAGGQNVWCIPHPSRTRSLYIYSHQLFRTVACSSRSDCTRCVVFFSLASLSEYPGRLATHGCNCVLVVRDAGVLHSSALSINSLLGQFLSVLQLWIVNWVTWRQTLCNS